MRMLLIFSGLLLCAGCMSRVKAPEKQAEPQVVMPASVAGNNIPEEDLDRVRYGEDLKAYAVGRYIDPNNSSIMYEKNILYRVEESPQWNLRPNTELRPPIGKIPRESPALQKIMESELRNELERQRRLSEDLLQQTKKAVEAVEKSIAETRRLQEHNALVLRKIGEQGKQITDMEVKMRDFEAERTMRKLKTEAENE